jgi:hypothetical protein
VIALLAVERDRLIAKPPETLQRKRVIRALRLLQAQNVRPHRLDEFGDEIDAQPHRIDVPGCQRKAQGNQKSVFNNRSLNKYTELKYQPKTSSHPRFFSYCIVPGLLA